MLRITLCIVSLLIGVSGVYPTRAEGVPQAQESEVTAQAVEAVYVAPASSAYRVAHCVYSGYAGCQDGPREAYGAYAVNVYRARVAAYRYPSRVGDVVSSAVPYVVSYADAYRYSVA